MNLSISRKHLEHLPLHFFRLAKNVLRPSPFESFCWAIIILPAHFWADDQFPTFTVTCYGLTDGINGFTKQCEGDDFGSIVKFHQLLAQRLPASLHPLSQRRRRSRSHHHSNGEDVPGGGFKTTRRVSGWGVFDLLGNAERFRCFSFFGWLFSWRFFFADTIPYIPWDSSPLYSPPSLWEDFCHFFQPPNKQIYVSYICWIELCQTSR